jgi:hypothetical protein
VHALCGVVPSELFSATHTPAEAASSMVRMQSILVLQQRMRRECHSNRQPANRTTRG